MLYIKSNKSRAVIDLSGIWQFKLDDGTGFENNWMARPLEYADNLYVPASYNDQQEKLAYRDHCGWAFYQCTFTVPQMLVNNRVVLRFGAVTHEARVYLNGLLITEHKGGFLPFETEITNRINDGENLLCVAVSNRVSYSTLPVGNEHGTAFFGSESKDLESIRMLKIRDRNSPNFDFFNYAGIHRPVKIYTTPKSYIKDIVLTPDIEGADGVVKYTIECQGEGQVNVIILDENKRVVAESKGKTGCLIIKDAKLWEPGNAYLYQAIVTFGDDCYEQEFGVRTVEVKGTQFLINRKPFYFKGFGKHEDSDFYGRGMNQALNVKDISLMKWLHANSFRTSHYPYSEEMMNLCDREGIVVIDEVPAVGLNFGWNDPEGGYAKFKTTEHHREVIQDLIERDKNHPCVVMWSIANEPDTEKQPQEAYNYFKPLYDLAHQLDSQNRPVTLVACQNDYLRDITAPAMDVICVNRYYGWYELSGDLELAGEAFKNEMEYWQKIKKPWMITEYGADTISGLHSVLPNMWSEEFQTEFYRVMNSILDQYDFVVGEQLWNFADFNTIQGMMRVGGNKKGIFTRDRKPKLAAHYFKDRWEKSQR
ncbi:beta-glucuronidase [Lacrimispora amygdalina]|jgi:beta-glucuronidase|uniref:Beta-glucuronidase n=1 Tax=Lacrimispora amygdalina TaxID=253257 RepID=A0A3E2NEY1_9FIRM|nr:beta-glucuronidase [Clostridium indicum]RFZ79577.1 beta-glucuronidase [Clostridium indicum]